MAEDSSVSVVDAPVPAGAPSAQTNHRLLLLLSLLYVVLLLVQLGARSTDVPWTVDNGIKWLLAEHGEDGLRGSLPYLGRELDPSLRFLPIRPPFAANVDGRFVAQYPPAFSLLSRPFLRLFGEYGAFVLPMLGALLSAWGAMRLAGRWDPRAGVWAYLFAGPLGPLAWYGTTFWEHTLVAACVIWAVCLWFERPASTWRPALLLSLATWLREETVLVVLAILVAALLGRSTRRWRSIVNFVAIYVLAAAVFLAWQFWATGTAFGIHVSGNLHGTVLDLFREGRLGVVRGLLWSGDEGSSEAGDLVLTLIAMVLALLIQRRARGRVRSFGVGAETGLVGGIALVCIFALNHEYDMPMTLIRTAGLFFFAPWVLMIPALTPSREEAMLWAGPGALLLFLVVTPSVTAFGFHWGPRILLTIVPLLATAAALGLRALRAGTSGHLPRIGIGFMVLSCFALQVFGGSLQARVTRGAHEELTTIRAFVEKASGRAGGEASSEPARSASPSADTVPLVTHQWWYASTFAPLLTELPVYSARNRVDLMSWVDTFREAGGRRFVWATAARRDDILNGLGVRVIRRESVEGYPKSYRHRLLEVEVLPETRR
ncbi:MAG: glycosyltransferase family 87 protein [Candidatus Eisenbacteria bacterium]